MTTQFDDFATDDADDGFDAAFGGGDTEGVAAQVEAVAPPSPPEPEVQRPKTPIVDWDYVERFLLEIGRFGAEDGSDPLVLSVFPQGRGANIHLPAKWGGALPRRDVHRLLMQDSERSLGMVINSAGPAPEDWGSLPDHFSGRTTADKRARRDAWVASGGEDWKAKPRVWGAANDQVTRVVGGFAECDGGLSIEEQRQLPELAGLPAASLRVWTGGKSLHQYWLLRRGESLATEEFRRLQRALARAIQVVAPEAGVDESISNPSRVMRVPGGWHPRSGERAKLDLTGGPRYTAAELMAVVADVEARFPEVAAQAGPGRVAPGGFLPAEALSWFNRLSRRQKTELAVEMLRLIPRRGEPGSGTYEAAFGAVCSLVHEFGSRGALEVIELAGWHSEHWDVVEKVEDVHSSGTERGMGSLIRDARSAGWVHPLDREPVAREAGPPAEVREAEPPAGGFIGGGPPEGGAAAGGLGGDTFKVLGWGDSRSSVYYQRCGIGQIGQMRPAGSAELLKMAPVSWWAAEFPVPVRGDAAPTPNWTDATSAVIEAANAIGLFDPVSVRGSGVWIDKGRVVWHLGDRLEVDGELMEISSFQGQNPYTRAVGLSVDPSVAPLTDTEGSSILELIRDMGWESQSDYLHLAGWAVTSSVGGALHKRPGLQITSSSGTGKTTVVDLVISPLQAGLALDTSGSTEAGVRQLLGRSSLPALIDESEQADGYRREAQLALVRYAYDGKPQVKGSPQGTATRFQLRSSIALIGINSGITNTADRNRIAVVARAPIPDRLWEGVAARIAELLSVEVGERLLRRTVNNVRLLRANALAFGAVVAARHGARTGETYGTLLAGAHLLTELRELTTVEASMWMAQRGWAIDEEAQEVAAPEHESLQCLEFLLAHVPDKQEGRSVRELLKEQKALASSAFTRDDPVGGGSSKSGKLVLGRLGLRYVAEGDVLAMATGPASLMPRVYGDTQWAKGAHKQRLLDLEGAEKLKTVVRFPVIGVSMALTIPFSWVSREQEEGEAADGQDEGAV